MHSANYWQLNDIQSSYLCIVKRRKDTWQNKLKGSVLSVIELKVE